jgi:hypothetical protein
MSAITIGFRYFAIIFAFAFVMGVLRTLVIAPRLGATTAVLIEIPILLGASWLVALRLLRDLPFKIAERVAIGAIAISLTMASEAVLAGAIRGLSVTQWAQSGLAPLGLVGLAGQLGFAALPVLTRRAVR